MSSRFAAHFISPKLPTKASGSRGIYASIHAPSPPHSPRVSSIPSPTLSTQPMVHTPSQKAKPETKRVPPPIIEESPADGRPSSDTHRSSTSTTRPTNVIVSISPPEELYKGDDYVDSTRFTSPRSPPTPGSQNSTSIVLSSTLATPEASPITPSSNIDARTEHFDRPDSEPTNPSPPSNPQMEIPDPPANNLERPQETLPAVSEGKEKQGDETESRSSSSDESRASLKQPNQTSRTKRHTRIHSVTVVKVLEDALGTKVAMDDLDSDNGSDTNTVQSSEVSMVPPKASISSESLAVVPPRRLSSLRAADFLKEQEQLSGQQGNSLHPPQLPPPQQQQQISEFGTLHVRPALMARTPSNRSIASIHSNAGPPPTVPPTTPLPSPPPPKSGTSLSPCLSHLPSIPSINSLPSQRSSALLKLKEVDIPRPRAQTISSSVPPQNKLRNLTSSISSRSLASSSNSSPRQPILRFGGEVISEDQNNKENRPKATYEELERRLIEVQTDYNVLNEYLETVEMERDKAKRKVEKLRKEVEKWNHEAKSRSAELRDSRLEMEGYKLLIHSRFQSSSPRPDPDRDDESTDVGSFAPSFSFGIHPEESGSSGVVDLPSRKRSMTIHDFRPSPGQLHRLGSIPSLKPSATNSNGMGLGFRYPHRDRPYAAHDSGPPTASSSTSSLTMAPGLTATSSTASSGLSSIPESSSPRNSLDTPVEISKEERRSSQISYRTSRSSLVSSQSAIASQAYSSNLKSGRGHSIEQVDRLSPNMNDVMEKLQSLEAE